MTFWGFGRRKKARKLCIYARVSKSGKMKKQAFLYDKSITNSF